MTAQQSLASVMASHADLARQINAIAAPLRGVCGPTAQLARMIEAAGTAELGRRINAAAAPLRGVCGQINVAPWLVTPGGQLPL